MPPVDRDQEKVVAHETGPAVVLAGAGSGKTRCTTERAARRIREGVDPKRLVMLTFTNKAAREMRERLTRLVPQGTRKPWIGTFHAYGSFLLRTYGGRIGISRRACLIDADDADRMLKSILSDDFRDTELKAAMKYHEAVVSSGLEWRDQASLPRLHRLAEACGLDGRSMKRAFAGFEKFEEAKRRANLVDFGDLLVLPARLLERDAELAASVRNALDDLTVDEAQDTNAAQFRLLDLLMPGDRTVILVGDDDQAIYEWRHARPQNMMDFIEHHGATVYRLERNYRSRAPIVERATMLVENNEDRLEKNPYATRRDGADRLPSLSLHERGEEMARAIAIGAADAIARGKPAGEVAVIYRINRLADMLQEALLKDGIPFQIKGGTNILERAEVRMMLALGRYALNRSDRLALDRIAEMVPGLGTRGASRIAHGEAPSSVLKKGASRAFGAMESELDALYEAGPESLAVSVLEMDLFWQWLRGRQRASLKRMLEKGKTPPGLGIRGEIPEAALDERIEQMVIPRLEAVQRIITARMRFDGAGDLKLPRQWVHALEVVMSGDDDEEMARDKVLLSTIHGVKGLEFSEVHVAGFSEGIMPLAHEGEVQNLPEERRVLYVAMTRAKDVLHLHHAQRLPIGGNALMRDLSLSRFAGEIGRVIILGNRAAA